MLEAYQAYGDYHTMMELTEKLVGRGDSGDRQELILPWGEKQTDFTPPFPAGPTTSCLPNTRAWRQATSSRLRRSPAKAGLETAGKHPDVIKNQVFEAKVEDQLAGPIFVLDYPASICR